ncbi:hypothetical protein BH11MYX4_BH11MYX4_67940 [soil metagenome]
MPTVGLRVCAACARAVGRLAGESPGAYWVIEGDRPPPAGGGDPAFGTMLRAFQRGVAERISAADSESHYHLAHAYRAMGLYADAVTAAGTALGADAPTTEAALCLLLTPPLLREGGLEALRGQLGNPCTSLPVSDGS